MNFKSLAQVIKETVVMVALRGLQFLKRLKKTLATLKLRESRVDLTKPSKDRATKVEDTPWGTIYISKPLTAGNSKLDKSMLIFDILAIYTCPNCSSCASKCYAVKAQKQYADTWNKRLINTWLAVYRPKLLEELITEQLNRSEKTKVRIHSSGDFFAPHYYAMWVRISEKFSGKDFYSYTKADTTIVDRSLLPENFNMVESILPLGDLNIIPVRKDWETADPTRTEAWAYWHKLYAKYKAKGIHLTLCTYGIAKSEVRCGVDCLQCLNKSFVCFFEH